MAKSINEINALNSLNKAQALSEAAKPKRGGRRSKAAAKAAAARIAAAKGYTLKPTSPKAAKGAAVAPRDKQAASGLKSRSGTARSTSGSVGSGRAATKKTQRAAARSLFAESYASDMRVPGDSLRATNLGATSPLLTLAPGAILRPAPGFEPLTIEIAKLPRAYQSVLPATRNVGIGQLYSALAGAIGSNRAYAFCESILQQRWQTFMAAAKSWQEDMALNAALDEQAAIRSQQRAAEEKRAHDASQATLAASLKAAQASLEATHAAVQATLLRRRVRPRGVSAPVRLSSASATTSAGSSSSVATVTTFDTLDSSPVAGLALMPPALPAARPAPASPQERGARQAKRLRQSADADLI